MQRLAEYRGPWQLEVEGVGIPVVLTLELGSIYSCCLTHKSHHSNMVLVTLGLTSTRPPPHTRRCRETGGTRKADTGLGHGILILKIMTV